MRKASLTLLAIGLLAFAAGCGEDEDGTPETPATPTQEGATDKDGEATRGEEDPMGQDDDAAATDDTGARGTTVVLGDSEFGEMLYDANDQAIYVFERDSEGTSNCYGECAAAWPPVLTEGEPVAGQGVDSSLLGTSKRSDGSTQLTYGGRPLYYYVNEGPGEVRCHNVDLNGGLWWVVGADGEPLA